MNKMLASTLSTLNVLYALIILVVCIFFGATYLQPPGQISIFGSILGLIVGVVAASMVCGLIAFLTLIERHLGFLVSSAEYQNSITKIRMERDTKG